MQRSVLYMVERFRNRKIQLTFVSTNNTSKSRMYSLQEFGQNSHDEESSRYCSEEMGIWDTINPVEIRNSITARTKTPLTHEKERLLHRSQISTQYLHRFIIEFAIETGMRRSEILKLKWCDHQFRNWICFSL